ncbi:MAG: thioredoxin family protein [Bdellovibrionaceae bacterium]|nr:thioredoxin family protein [Pseudobdellovibrionaceae bacterium]
MPLTYTPQSEKGKPCPDFDLPIVTGGRMRRADIPAGRAFLVMFICNHCPYVQAVEDRLITLGHELKAKGIPVVAICSNDPVSYPEDSFEKLRERAIAKAYPFAYLHDGDQSVARAFGAVCTPDFFVFDREGRLAWRGRLDDNWKEPEKVTRRELFNAITRLDEGLPLVDPEVPSMGCSIKWFKS